MNLRKDILLISLGALLFAAGLTVWSMIYYLRKALPEIRAKAR